MPISLQTFERRMRCDRRCSDPHPVTEELAEAITQNDIELLFQAQWRSWDGGLAGAEALIRWDHAEHGVLPGDALVAIAHNGGLSRRLSRHITRAALKAARAWPDDLRLSLNVSAIDLFERTFADNLLTLRDESGFPAERLTLEITEQALVADLDRSAQCLKRLADAGIRIALDDFGAGFCNFRYLKVLPLHTLKLDRSMIEGIATDARDMAVLRGIIAMARALDLCVIAEGIETAAQRDLAVAEGCDGWQGYLGGKPVPAEGFDSAPSAFASGR